MNWSPSTSWSTWSPKWPARRSTSATTSADRKVCAAATATTRACATCWVGSRPSALNKAWRTPIPGSHRRYNRRLPLTQNDELAGFLYVEHCRVGAPVRDWNVAFRNLAALHPAQPASADRPSVRGRSAAFATAFFAQRQQEGLVD